MSPSFAPAAIPAQTFLTAMQEAYTARTGLPVHAAADVGIRMAALAHQLAALSEEAAATALDAFPQTASGEALDRHAQAKGLARRPGAPAAGILRFSRATPAPADLELPAGTLCATPSGLRFATTAPGILPAGQTALDLPAAAVEPGPQGNVPAGEIRVIISSAPDFSAVVNPLAFTGGTDAEDDDALRARLCDAYADPATSANAAFYRNLARAVSGVAAVKILPKRRGPGTVDLLFASPSPAQTAIALQAALDSAAPAGVDVLARPAQISPTEVAATLTLAPGTNPESALQACTQAVSALFARLEIGEPLPCAALIAALMGGPGVQNAVLLLPAADLLPADDAILTLAGCSLEQAVETP